jgi:hypothetical protein
MRLPELLLVGRTVQRHVSIAEFLENTRWE